MKNKKKRILIAVTFSFFTLFLLQEYTSGAQDTSTCKETLELVGKAIKFYQSINGKLPEKLSELWSRGLVRNFEDFLCPGSETVIDTIEDIDKKTDFEIPTSTSQEGNYPLVVMKAKEGQPRFAFLSDGSTAPYEPGERTEAPPTEREQPTQPTETTTQPEITEPSAETEREVPATTTREKTTPPPTQPEVPTTEKIRDRPTTTTREPSVSEELERPDVDRTVPESLEAERDIPRSEQPRETEPITSETAPSIPERPSSGPVTSAARGPLSPSTAITLAWILAIAIIIMLALTILLMRRRGVLAPAGPPSPKIDLNLEITDPKGKVRTISPTSAPLEIGRHPSNDVTLDDPSVSRRHARIIIKEGRFWLVNLSESENTLLDNKITNQAEIFQGSVIQLGSTLIRVL